MSEEINKHIAGLLRKYSQGRLSAVELAELQQLAEEDPFVADAMEGLTAVDHGELQASLASLDDRMAPLISPKAKKRHLVPWRRIAGVAAIALLIISTWGIWNATTQRAGQPSVSQATDARSPVESDNDKIASQAVEDPQSSTSDEPELPAVANAESTVPPGQSDPAALEIRDGKRTQEQALILDGVAISSKEEDGASADLGMNSTTTENVADEASEQNLSLDQARTAPFADDEQVAKTLIVTNQISGIIKDNTGEPLIGANVVVKGTDNGVVTDFDGNFLIDVPELQEPAAEPTLVVSYTGYQTLEQQAYPGDLLEIEMHPGGTLEEAVITGYARNQPTSHKAGAQRDTRSLAQPVDGQRKYNRYVKQNLQYPAEADSANVRGEVVLEFDLDAQGRPTQIRVVQSLGFGCDEEAIRLLQAGPDWDVKNSQVPIGRLAVIF